MTLAPPPPQGPYLFFETPDLPSLRARAERAPYTACRDRILATAARLLDDPIPPQPAAGPPTQRDANGYLDAYLEAHYDFQAAGLALLNYGQVLAFAHLLNDEAAYAERAAEWARSIASWSAWAPQADPQGQSGHALTGLALLYDWLADRLDGPTKEQLRAVLVHRLDALRQNEAYAASGSAAWIQAAAAGLTALALLRDCPQATAWVQHWTDLFTDTLLPAGFGADGAFVEGVGWWDVCALRAGLLFFDALKRRGGPDLFADRGLRAYPGFLLQSSRAADRAAGPQTASWGRFLPPSPLHYRYVLLRLAAAYGDPGLLDAAGDDLDVPAGTPLDWFYHHLHRRPYRKGRWYTATLTWDAPSGRCSVGIDGQDWSFEAPEPTALERIDGLRFAGGGLRLRHLGMRAGDGPATALLERDTELTVGQAADVAGPVLEADGLRLRFPAAASGTVWFQLFKTDLEAGAAVHLQSASGDGPGLHLQAVDLFPAPGADFCLCRGDHPPWPPGAHAGGSVWFDGPWEYLWHPQDPPTAVRPPRPSVHFAKAGLSFLRDEASGVELRFRSGPAAGRDRGDQNAFSIRLKGHPVAGDLPQAASGLAHLSQRQYDLDTFFLNTFAANTVLVDENPQQRSGQSRQWGQDDTSTHNGRTTAFLSSPPFDAVSGEAANAYADLQGFRRRIAFVKPDYLVVVDHLSSARPEGTRPPRVDWLLHAADRLCEQDGTLRLESAAGALETFILYPGDAAPQHCQTPAPLARQRTAYLRLPLEGPQPGVVAVLVPVPPDAQTPLRPEVLEGHGGRGIQLRRGNARDWLLCRDPQSPTAAAAGVRTDAEVAFLRRERDLPTLAAFLAGTRLHWRTELAGADTPVDLALQRSASRLRAWVQTRQATRVHLLTGTRPRYVRLGDQRLDARAWSYSPQGRRLALDLEAGDHQLDVALK